MKNIFPKFPKMRYRNKYKKIIGIILAVIGGIIIIQVVPVKIWLLLLGMLCLLLGWTLFRMI